MPCAAEQRPLMGLGFLFLKSQTHVEQCGGLSWFFRGQHWGHFSGLEERESINIEHRYTSCQTQGPQTDCTGIWSTIKCIHAVLIPKFSSKCQPNVRFMFFKIMFFALKELSKLFLLQPGPKSHLGAYSCKPDELNSNPRFTVSCEQP